MFAFQGKIEFERKRREGKIKREKLCDLWPEDPFLDKGGPSLVKRTKYLPKEDTEDVAVVDAELVEMGVAETVISESDALLVEVRRAKLEKLGRQTQLLNLHIEIAQLDLAERRAKANIFS